LNEMGKARKRVSSCGQVEAFAEVLASGDDDEILAGRRISRPVPDLGAGTLAEAALEHDRGDAATTDRLGKQVALLLPLAEDDARALARLSL
jgi:hypothetical protein